MKKRLLPTWRTAASYWLCWLVALLPLSVAAVAEDTIWQPLQVERLPDLNTPRLGHTVFCAGGEVVVAGGHTSGFVPTQTAEYYRDGAWHQLQMVYPHDQGGTAVMPSGQVMLFGGHEQALGIGQTFTLEIYDPATHSFKGYGCLERKRCFTNALPLDSGRIAISGNWFQDDCIELFDGSRQCQLVKPAAQHRHQPHIIRTAQDNAIIFSPEDIHADAFDTIIVDRLKGEPFTVPLFQTWRPISLLSGTHGACFIGNEAKGDYTSLIQVVRGDSLMAIATVTGEDFSLLPTTLPIPMRSPWSDICWYAPIVADSSRGRAYIVGYGENYPTDQGDHRFYVCAIDYQQRPAPITLFYSEPTDSAGRYYPVLTADGDLMVAGGILHQNNNYEAAATAFLLRVASPAALQHESHAWVWQLVALYAAALLIAVAAIAFAIRYLLRRRKQAPTTPENEAAEGSPLKDAELMQRIHQLMVEQRLYLNSELKLADVARLLNTNSAYVSSCINSQRGCSFTQFVNAYRIEHAQELFRQEPEKKVYEVWPASGFSTETSFFRTFKTVTGMTPSEWKQQKID